MKGEEDKLFDDFLRKAVGNYQVKPSPAIWKGILQKVPARRIGRIPFSGGNSGIMGLISGGIIITSVAVYNHNSNLHHPVQPDSAGTLSARTVIQQPALVTDSSTFVYNPQNIKPIEDNLPETIKNSIPLSQKNQPAGAKPASSAVSAYKPVTAVLLQKKSGKNEVIPSSESKDTYYDPSVESPVRQDNRHTENNTSSAPLASALKPSGSLAQLSLVSSRRSYYYELAAKASQNLSIQTDPLRQGTKAMKISKWQGDYAGSNNEILVGAYYQPEWLNKPSGSRFGSTRQNGGLLLSWNKKPFMIETGIGIMQEKARQNYDIYYHQLLGTYNNLQYVTFDTAGGVIVPHYYYAIDSVFDPDQKLQQHSGEATYTYLQIPLSLGLEKSIGRHSFSIKTGPVLSLLVQTSESKLIIDPDKHVVLIAGDHAGRLKTSWQWSLALGYRYSLTDRISVFAEPGIRSYLGTPYEKKRTPNENPLFIGIRTGISFQFKNPVSK